MTYNQMPPSRNPTPTDDSARHVGLVLVSDGFIHTLQTTDGAIVDGIGMINIEVLGQEIAKMNVNVQSFAVQMTSLATRMKGRQDAA